MNDFIEECRTEWRRLGVPDPIANEMAADLAADLDEAAAEGATPEDVLGAGVFDARAFAAAWAAERGVISRPPSSARGRRRPSVLPLAVAALSLVAIVGAALVIVASPASEAPQGLVPPPALSPAPVMVTSPDGKSVWMGPTEGAIFAVGADEGSSDTARIVGSVLLAVALAAILLATLLSWWRGGDRVPSGHAY